MSEAIEFGQEVSPAAVGMSVAGVSRIQEIFERQINEKEYHPAAQLVVLRRGEVIVDRAMGEARGRPVRHDTPFLTLSVTKAFTGMCVHKLIEEGKVAWDAPVAEYWPAFGQGGKEAATIRQVFLHQAGIPVRGLYRQIPLWPFWERVTVSVARLEAEYQPGTKTAYHLVNYGFILGEVVRRVTGQAIAVYLREIFLDPMGLEHTWLGIAHDELQRSPRLHYARDVELYQKGLAWLFNRGAIRRAVVPAATLHSTARDLAVFYQMLVNGGEYGGRRYLQAETIAAATALGYEGYDAVMEETARWAHGFHLGGRAPTPGLPGPTMGERSTVRTFGHFGNRTCMAWADPEAELVVAFTCNRLLDHYHSRARWKAISDAVWEAIRE